MNCHLMIFKVRSVFLYHRWSTHSIHKVTQAIFFQRFGPNYIPRKQQKSRMHLSSLTLTQAHHTDSENQKTVVTLVLRLPSVSESWMVIWSLYVKRRSSFTAIGMNDFIFITVLRRLFVSVLKFSFVFIGRKRVLNIAHHFMATGAAKKENRGGSRNRLVNESITNSIISHTQSFYVRSSHYMHNKSCRQYLATELTVRKMRRLWKSQLSIKLKADKMLRRIKQCWNCTNWGQRNFLWLWRSCEKVEMHWQWHWTCSKLYRNPISTLVRSNTRINVIRMSDFTPGWKQTVEKGAMKLLVS